jgi:uncharacterized membrane protein YccC
MKKINLEEILDQCLETPENLESNSDNTKTVLKAMKEACRQTLELAAENATTEHTTDRDTGWIISIANKQSILDVINLIE